MESQLRRDPHARINPSELTYFAGIAGTGLDAAVNRLTLKQPRWLRSHGGYVVALLRVLGSFRPPRVTLSVELADGWETRINQPGFLVAAGNGPQYGHRMRLTHQAQMDDGLLDVCFVRTLSKMRLLRLFKSVYAGDHIGLEEVKYFRATRLRLDTEPLSEVFADGEYIVRTPVEIGVQRDALSVIVNP
jgi:diacylglycerol kinase family enzyme